MKVILPEDGNYIFLVITKTSIFKYFIVMMQLINKL
jgi:hypothetical protein